jgi:hypothetical protein
MNLKFKKHRHKTQIYKSSWIKKNNYKRNSILCENNILEKMNIIKSK